MERYRVLDHTADTAIEADALSVDSLFENLAYGMFDLMFDLSSIRSQEMTKIEVSASSLEELVVDTLSELLALAETQDRGFASFSARVNEKTNSTRVIAAGSPVTSADLRGPPIKAVTYHDLEITRREAGWYGRVVFDV